MTRCNTWLLMGLMLALLAGCSSADEAVPSESTTTSAQPTTESVPNSSEPGLRTGGIVERGIDEPDDVPDVALGFSEDPAAPPLFDDRGLIDDDDAEQVEVEANQVGVGQAEAVLCTTVEFALDADLDGVEPDENAQIRRLAETPLTLDVSDFVAQAVAHIIMKAQGGDPSDALVTAMAVCESIGYER